MATYLFLEKQKYRPRIPKLAISKQDALRAIKYLGEQPGQKIHYDLETVGLQAEDENRLVTNVGIATKDHLIGISLVELTQDEIQPLWEWMRKCTLGGFNLKFDMSWPWGIDVPWDNYGVCTNIMFRWLASESIMGQTHSLENAIEDILGWPAQDFQKTWLKEHLQKYSLKKDEMWRLAQLEPTGYTKYCALDAEASWQLEEYFTKVIKQNGFDWWFFYNDNIVKHKIFRNIQAKYHGIPIDRDQCKQWIDKIRMRVTQLYGQILQHPMVAEHLSEFYEMKCNKTYQLKVVPRKKYAKAADNVWENPEEWTFEPSDAKLPKWAEPYGGKFYKVEPSFSIKGQKKSYPVFNVSSPDDMKWLIYDKWLQGKYEIVQKTFNRPDGTTQTIPLLVKVTLAGKEYELDLTKAKDRPTGGDIMKLFGEVGKLIERYKFLQKLLGDFLIKYYAASERTGCIHPTLKILGAATGRSTGE